MISRSLLGVALVALVALPAQAQDLDFDVDEAQEAVNEMIARVHVHGAVEPKSVADIVARLDELGYTEIEDFDVEWDVYEVEAVTPDGDEVELEIDPISGRILEIEEDFF